MSGKPENYGRGAEDRNNTPGNVFECHGSLKIMAVVPKTPGYGLPGVEIVTETRCQYVGQVNVQGRSHRWLTDIAKIFALQ